VLVGWTKRTRSPAPIEKLVQSIAALSVPWVMSCVLPTYYSIVNWPDTT
jgi:hypothetical protein